MKDYIKKYKPFLFFLLRFVVGYILMATGYHLYLSQFEISDHEVDSITEMVAHQSSTIVNGLGYSSYTQLHLNEASVRFYVEGQYVARIIEGCNAVSVMILFVAFVVAFRGPFIRTFFFSLVGLVLLYGLNLVRIALLSIGLLHYPEYEHFLHGVVFPLFIYGVVFFLWIVWVRKYSYYATKTTVKG